MTVPSIKISHLRQKINIFLQNYPLKTHFIPEKALNRTIYYRPKKHTTGCILSVFSFFNSTRLIILPFSDFPLLSFPLIESTHCPISDTSISSPPHKPPCPFLDTPLQFCARWYARCCALPLRCRHSGWLGQWLLHGAVLPPRPCPCPWRISVR